MLLHLIWLILSTSKPGLPAAVTVLHKPGIGCITNVSYQIPVGKTFLATSDVIESIFGKYKNLSSRCPIKQMGQMVLNISLCTMNLATSVIKQALENVRYIDLKDWSSQVFGQSMLSKRKIVFSTWDNDTEFA